MSKRHVLDPHDRAILGLKFDPQVLDLRDWRRVWLIQHAFPIADCAASHRR